MQCKLNLLPEPMLKMHFEHIDTMFTFIKSHFQSNIVVKRYKNFKTDIIFINLVVVIVFQIIF